MSAGPAAAPASALSRRFPPVAELAVVSLASVVVGGILMASYAPRRPPLGVPVALALADAVLVVASGYLASGCGSSPGTGSSWSSVGCCWPT